MPFTSSRCNFCSSWPHYFLLSFTCLAFSRPCSFSRGVVPFTFIGFLRLQESCCPQQFMVSLCSLSFMTLPLSSSSYSLQLSPMGDIYREVHPYPAVSADVGVVLFGRTQTRVCCFRVNFQSDLFVFILYTYILLLYITVLDKVVL